MIIHFEEVTSSVFIFRYSFCHAMRAAEEQLWSPFRLAVCHEVANIHRHHSFILSTQESAASSRFWPVLYQSREELQCLQIISIDSVYSLCSISSV